MATTPTKTQTASGSDPKTWTVMVYMAAGQSHDLDTVAVRDLKEMELGCKENEHVNVVVQVDRHWPPTAQRYHIQEGETTFVPSPLTGETNMGKGQTLTDFVTWVAGASDYAAQNYCLVLWGHSYGLGFGRDHQDPLRLREIADALEAFKKARRYKPEGSDGTLELLGANACAMSYLEAAFELRRAANFMVASQITVPFAGFPYDVILGRITSETSPVMFARLIADAFVSQFDELPGGDKLAMTVLNLGATTGLDVRVDALARAIDREISPGFNSETLSYFRDVFMGAAAGDVRPLIDLTTLCRTLAARAEEAEPDAVSQAASALLDDIEAREFDQTRFLTYHRRNAALDDLNGIGIFAPFITDKAIVERLELDERTPNHLGAGDRLIAGRDEYKQLAVFKSGAHAKAAQGAWPRLVYDGLRRTIPADLMVAIDGIGEMQTGDRADVAQIVMSIDSALNQLDRAVAKAKGGILAVLNPLAAAKPMSARSTTSQSSPAADGPPRSFNAPWLQLLAPPSVEVLRQAQERRQLMPGPAFAVRGEPIGEAITVTAGAVDPTVVTKVVGWLGRVEGALSGVERVTRRGLTHARYGLGLLNPNQSGFGLEPPKSGNGLEPPKSGNGLEPPKSGNGVPGAVGPDGAPNGDLREDLALMRVADLFRQVGAALADLEQAAADLEDTARTTLILPDVETGNPRDTNAAAAQAIERGFHLLQEASANARRTVRRVLAHPVYGLGPGEGELTFDVRQELALRGGLDKRTLRLL